MTARELPDGSDRTGGPIAPPAAQVRRAVGRARRGAALDVEEATAALHARGDDLVALCDAAARVRDAGLAAAGRAGVVTYSRKVFVPLTRLCRDRCHYCAFATTPRRLRDSGHGMFLEPDEVLAIARDGAAAGCKEALFTLGDRPEDRWPDARSWLDERGYDDTLSYVRAMAVRVLEETGLLPHLNPGVMSWEELRRLRPVAPSMGLMLETTSERLWAEPGGPHFGSPDKEPALRLRVLEDAGRVGIPFTTGILVGIGETPRDRAESLFAIRRAAREHGHVQEVIVQNFRAKPDTAMRRDDDLAIDDYLATLAVARLLLGPRARIQAPPNLSAPEELPRLLAAGVDDWGGVSPLTPDHVNPERPWPHLDDLVARTRDAGFDLRERLTVHPEYVRRASAWLDPRVRPHVEALAGPDGLAVEGRRPVGLPWQEPDGGIHGGASVRSAASGGYAVADGSAASGGYAVADGSAASGGYAAFAARSAGGRTDLHVDIDVHGRTADRRGDFDHVYGDWDSVRERARNAGAPVRPAREVRHALSLAADDPAALAEPHHRDSAVALMSCEGEALETLCTLADEIRRDAVGDDVTYVVNRNINFTNVCYTGCRFCAFAQRESDADAYTLSLQQVGDRAAEAWAMGATEVCMQGGIHPDLPGTAYFDLVREVKRRAPGLHVHAFSPMEVVNGATRSGLSVREWLTEARAAGLDSIPGTAAEILDDDVRWVLTKGKLPTSAWIDVVTTAHEVGLPSSATMMFGHVDSPAHWVDHLLLIRSLQQRTGGFTEFVPLPFVHHQAPVYLAGIARPGPTERDNRAVHAMARLLLHGAVRNVQCSWVKLGPDGCVTVLRGGVNDLGGTLMEETISRMAGSEHGSAMTADELEAVAATAGRPARQRTTTYGVVPAERRAAARNFLPVTPVRLDSPAATRV